MKCAIHFGIHTPGGWLSEVTSDTNGWLVLAPKPLTTENTTYYQCLYRGT